MKRPMSVVLVVMAVLALSAFSAAGAYAEGRGVASMQADEPLEVANAFVGALNSHDIDAVIALFDENATVTTAYPNQTPSNYSGAQEIGDFFESAVTGDNRFEIIGQPKVAGDHVTFVLRASGEDITGLGLDYVDFVFEIVAGSGKIQSLTISMTPEESARIAEAGRGNPESEGPVGMPTGDESGGNMPTGMPTTGNSSTVPMLPLALLAMGLISTGLALSRRNAIPY